MKKGKACFRWGPILLLGLLLISGIRLNAAESPFLQKYPELKKYLFVEPETNFYFGFGVTPIAILQNRIFFAGNIFQVHWMKQPFDIEIFSGIIGISSGRNDYTGSKNFLFRFSPKIQLIKYFSFGPMVGIEFVSFPDILSKICKDINGQNTCTPTAEPFSSRGMFYGIMFSEVLMEGEGYLLKVNQSIYKQTYSTTYTNNGWRYTFPDKPDLENDLERDAIRPSMVFMLEFSLLY